MARAWVRLRKVRRRVRVRWRRRVGVGGVREGGGKAGEICGRRLMGWLGEGRGKVRGG